MRPRRLDRPPRTDIHTHDKLNLTALEQQNCYLTQVEVDEVTGLVCHVGAKVTADDAVPGWIVFLVELFLDVCGNVLCDEMRKKGGKSYETSAEIVNLSCDD